MLRTDESSWFSRSGNLQSALKSMSSWRMQVRFGARRRADPPLQDFCPCVHPNAPIRALAAPAYATPDGELHYGEIAGDELSVRHRPRLVDLEVCSVLDRKGKICGADIVVTPRDAPDSPIAMALPSLRPEHLRLARFDEGDGWLVMIPDVLGHQRLEQKALAVRKDEKAVPAPLVEEAMDFAKQRAREELAEFEVRFAETMEVVGYAYEGYNPHPRAKTPGTALVHPQSRAQGDGRNTTMGMPTESVLVTRWRSS